MVVTISLAMLNTLLARLLPAAAPSLLLQRAPEHDVDQLKRGNNKLKLRKSGCKPARKGTKRL